MNESILSLASWTNMLMQRDIDLILRNVINRKKFQYSGVDILAFIARCLCCRKLKLSRFKGTKKEWDASFKKHYHFKEGEDKLSNELDVITLLKTLRKVKLLT